MTLNFNVFFLKISVFVSVGRIFGACENVTKASTTVKIFPTTASSFSLPPNISPTSSLVSSFPPTSSIAIMSESATRNLLTILSTARTSLLDSTFIKSTVTDSYQTTTLKPIFTSSGLSASNSAVFTAMSTRAGSEILSSNFLHTSGSSKSTSITVFETTSLPSSNATSKASLPSAVTSTGTSFTSRVTQSQVHPAEVSTVSVTSSVVMSSSVIVSSSIISTTTTTTTKKPTTMRATSDEEEDKTLVVGLSVGFSVAVVAIGCAIVIVIFWTRYGDRFTSSSKSASPPKNPEYAEDTKEPPADDSDVSSLDSSSSDSYSFCKDDHTTYAGIVNPVNIMYENNPDIIFVFNDGRTRVHDEG